MTELSQLILQTLECPFTWNMTKNNVTQEHDTEEYNIFDLTYPLFIFMQDITCAFVKSNNEGDFEEVCRKLAKCEEDFTCLQERAHKEISLKVVQHVLQATRMHVFYKYGKVEEYDSQFPNVMALNDLDLMENGTIEACKGLAWSKYDLSISIGFLRKAVEFNPKCDFWLYRLGRELRRKRRDQDLQTRPSEEELDCFKKAYEISRGPYLGVFLAQAFGENKNYIDANIIYKAIYETNPDNVEILSRLAIAFIRANNFPKAKYCLDKIEKVEPNHKLYLHYMGIYYMKTEFYEKAVPLLEKAINDSHMGVEKHYLFCKVKVDESFDATNYILGMIEKYKPYQFPAYKIQDLYLELAVSYAKKKDVINAMECFIEAIEMNPMPSPTLQNFRCCIHPAKSGNVCRLLKKDFLPKVKRDFGNDENVIAVANRLKKVIDENCRSQY